MHLIIVLRLLVGEDEVQRDLIRLVHHRAVAADHFAHVEVQHAGDRREILLSAGNQLIGGLRVGGVGPENDNVRKHRRAA